MCDHIDHSALKVSEAVNDITHLCKVLHDDEEKKIVYLLIWSCTGVNKRRTSFHSALLNEICLKKKNKSFFEVGAKLLSNSQRGGVGNIMIFFCSSEQNTLFPKWIQFFIACFPTVEASKLYVIAEAEECFHNWYKTNKSPVMDCFLIKIVLVDFRFQSVILLWINN